MLAWNWNAAWHVFRDASITKDTTIALVYGCVVILPFLSFSLVVNVLKGSMLN